jgi:hypothetical protein
LELNVSTNSTSIFDNVIIGTSAARRVHGNLVLNNIIGDFAANNLISGSSNTLIGSNVAEFHRYMLNNVAIGNSSLAYSSGGSTSATGSHYNIAIGDYSLNNLNDEYNIAIGYQAANMLRSGKI